MGWDVFTGFFGGVGLFLLGMRMMTQGLKKAAGNTLRSILGTWTRTTFRGILSGFLITALVQSSGAVIVAVVGFVNAGLMTLGQSIGVIYGSNIGTTITAWIVAAVGMQVDVKGVALPLIGLGAGLHLTGGGSTHRRPLGDALAGFGLFFLGLGALQSAFIDIQSSVDLASLTARTGMPCTVLFLALGILLTVLMQSSSAAMALVMTAAVSGLVDLQCAAAAVIGTNVGATSTSALSVIGATPNAKKVASTHIAFNLLTGAVALAVLPLAIRVVDWMEAEVGATGIATTLALFHTAFNVFGVVLLLPFTNLLVRLLDRFFASKAMDMARPKYLDANVLATPGLAVDALFMELGRLGEMARLAARKALTTDFAYSGQADDCLALSSLAAAVRSFCADAQEISLPRDSAPILPRALRVAQYYQAVGEILEDLAHTGRGTTSGGGEQLEPARSAFVQASKDLLNLAHTPCSPEHADLAFHLEGLTDIYHALKEALLLAGAEGRLDVEAMVRQLEAYSKARRMVEQAIKGSVHWAGMRDAARLCANATEENRFDWKLTG